MNRIIATSLGVACASFFLASGASAAIVCNEDGDCWHTKERYDYKPEFRLRIYDDNWKWDDRHRDRYRWREHAGRGYWRKGVWVEF